MAQQTHGRSSKRERRRKTKKKRVSAIKKELSEAVRETERGRERDVTSDGVDRSQAKAASKKNHQLRISL